MNNLSIWWDVHSKYVDDLEEHTTFETDDKIDDFIHIDNPKKKKKKTNKKKKLNVDPDL